MTSAARAGRRRRLLHEGSASGATPENATPEDAIAEGASGARYAPREGSSSFAVASRLFPQAWGAIAGVAVLFALSVAGLAALDVYSGAIDPSARFASMTAMAHPASLASWAAVAMWLVVAALAAVVFGLQRSRMDDLRCGYRWWAVGAVVAVAMSVNAATDAHGCFAALLAGATRFSPLPGDALWWLLPGSLVLGGLAIRLVAGASESRLALVFGVGATVVFTIGWVSDAGLAPASFHAQSPWLAASILGPAANLAALALTVIAMLFLSRQVVREAEGVVAPKSTTATRSKAKAAKREKPTAPTAEKADAAPKSTRRSNAPAKTVDAADTAEQPAAPKPKLASRTVKESPKPTRSQAREEAKQEPKEATSWVGGGDDYQDEYDDQPQRRRLSKAERKRLRKQKARRAA